MEGANIDFASFADTGQWKLFMEISTKGICAILQNITFAEKNKVMLLNKRWSPERETLLREIEDAVYDTPRLLDDFDTHIIISTPKALWIPSELCEEEEFNDKLFTDIYPCRREDIFLDYGDSAVCAYTLTPGLNSFLNRTIPGCKTTSHLTSIKTYIEKKEKKRQTEDILGDIMLYACVREGYSDIFAFNGGEFLCGATHEWKDPMDIAYKIALVGHAYHLPPCDITLNIYSNPAISDMLKSCLEKIYKDLNIKTPAAMTSESEIPWELTLSMEEG